MSFKKNKYSILKNAVSPEIANFVYQYFLNKRNVAKFLFDQKYISPFTEYWGNFITARKTCYGETHWFKIK